MRPEHFADLVADPHHGIQGKHRVLENHRDDAAANALHRALAEPDQFLSAQPDGAPHRVAIVPASRLRMASASVVLPQPDSPNSPTISPSPTSNETPDRTVTAPSTRQ